MAGLSVQIRRQASQQHAQAAAAEEEAAESKAYAAMEEMLGKAAARAWKAARDNAAGLADAKSGLSPSAQLGSSTAAQPELAGSAQPGGPTPVITVAGVPGAASGPTSPTAAGSSTAPDSPAAGAPEAGNAGNTEGSGDAGNSIAAEASAASGANNPAVPCSPRTAAAAAAQLLAAAASSPDPVEGVKLHLAALGVKDPADVSRTLMGELGARANLEGLLQAVADYLEKKGLPRRLNKKNSLKITRELNKR